MTGSFDAMIATREGERCLVHARVPPDLSYLAGHFPGNPIVPGVAQLIDLVLGSAQLAWPDLPPPTAIRRLKFLRALGPGDALEIELSREPERLRFEIRRGNERCTTGSLSLG